MAANAALFRNGCVLMRPEVTAVASVLATNRWTLTSPVSLQCPGCQQLVDVGRPPGVPVTIGRIQTSDGREDTAIDVGRITVHRCTLCVDGESR